MIQFYTYNISYSTREKFINLSWVGIQCDLYCIQREVFVVIFECTDFFFNILNNERYHLRVLKSQNIYLEGIHARFKLLLLTNIFTYMPSFFFFSNAIIMHILYTHAFSPYHFNGNCFNSYISCIELHSRSYKKKSMQSISWIFWLRIKGDVLKDLMSRGLTMEIALWLAADRVRWKSLQISCLKHLMVQRVLRERERDSSNTWVFFLHQHEPIYIHINGYLNNPGMRTSVESSLIVNQI